MKIEKTGEKEVSRPWWRFPIMWLVVGGPGIVVVAGFYTLYLAIANPDYLYTDEQWQEKVRAETVENKAAHAPAMQARNHAATGGINKDERASKKEE